jgi:CRP-like cAMP-binding protein
MVTAQELRAYPFFSGLAQGQLEAIAAIAKEVRYEDDVTLFEEGLPVKALRFLLDGCVELYYSTSADPHDQRLVCEINSGEPFAISALIEPYALTATARTSRPCRIIELDAEALRELFEKDLRLGYFFISRIAQTAMLRLHSARMRLTVQPSYA